MMNADCRRWSVGIALLVVLCVQSAGRGQEVVWRPSQRTALEAVTQREVELKKVNQQIWEFAEVGLEETRSSQLLVRKLKRLASMFVSALPTCRQPS